MKVMLGCRQRLREQSERGEIENVFENNNLIKTKDIELIVRFVM